MRAFVSIALLLTSWASAFADTALYISVAGEQKIAVYRMDPAEGRLTLRATTATAGEPGALAVDPHRRFLFASLRSTGQLASFRIDPGTGKLTHLSTVPAGADPAHLSSDRHGHFLLTAYYQAGKVTVHAIDRSGNLSARPLHTVGTAEKAHAILADPSNRFVFVPHTGPDRIFQFTFQARTGKLTPNTVPQLVTPKGTGPRHIAFHPSRDLAYVDNEQGSSVTLYRLDGKAGTLAAVQTLSTLPRGFKGANACAELKVHPGARFLYVSNRGHDSIACFTLGGDGRMAAPGQVATEKTPRSFDLDPAGQYLYAAGEASGKVAAYRIDPRTGALKRLATYSAGKQPWWVMAVELPAQ
jgi:6-phosphogluconolactonase